MPPAGVDVAVDPSVVGQRRDRSIGSMTPRGYCGAEPTTARCRRRSRPSRRCRRQPPDTDAPARDRSSGSPLLERRASDSPEAMLGRAMSCSAAARRSLTAMAGFVPPVVANPARRSAVEELPTMRSRRLDLAQARKRRVQRCRNWERRYAPSPSALTSARRSEREGPPVLPFDVVLFGAPSSARISSAGARLSGGGMRRDVRGKPLSGLRRGRGGVPHR
jgi:hypothetical protein